MAGFFNSLATILGYGVIGGLLACAIAVAFAMLGAMLSVLRAE